MKELRRIKQGDFDIKDCFSLDDIKNNKFKFINENLIFDKFKSIEVDEYLEKKIINGCILKNIYNEDIILFKNKDGKKLALYKIYEKDITKMKPFKMIL